MKMGGVVATKIARVVTDKTVRLSGPTKGFETLLNDMKWDSNMRWLVEVSEIIK